MTVEIERVVWKGWKFALLVSILSVIGVMLIIVITAIVLLNKRYKKELRSQDWYEEFQYEFRSADCSHDKQIKLTEIDWKFAFTMKREKNIKVEAGPFSKTIHQVHYRLFCNECGEKRWFEQTNSVLDHKELFRLRLKFLAMGAGVIMLAFILTMTIIFNFIVKICR